MNLVRASLSAVQLGAAPDGRFGLEAILDAAGAGEAHALVDALADTWIFNRTFQRLLIFGHDTSELPWYDLL